MRLRIHCFLPLCLLFACNEVERDWSKCSEIQPDCKPGYTCSPDFRCVPQDAGADATASSAADVADAPSEGGREVARAEAPTLTVDTAVEVQADPVLVDASADIPLDFPQADAPADTPADARPVDGAGTCGSDIDCPASLPMCLLSSAPSVPPIPSASAVPTRHCRRRLRHH